MARCINAWGLNHLMSQDRELVELHQTLVFPIDRLMGEESGGGDHIRRHAITYARQLVHLEHKVPRPPYKNTKNDIPMKKMTF